MIGEYGNGARRELRRGREIFEPTHGSAPKLRAARTRSNPIADDASRACDARHLDEDRGAAGDRETRSPDVIREGASVTYDMKPSRDDRPPSEQARSRTRSSTSSGPGFERTPQSVTVGGATATSADLSRSMAARDYADVVLVDIKGSCPGQGSGTCNQMGACSDLRAECGRSNGLRGEEGTGRSRDPAGCHGPADMSHDDIVSKQREDVGQVKDDAVAAESGFDPDPRLQPALTRVPCGPERFSGCRGSAYSGWPRISIPPRF